MLDAFLDSASSQAELMLTLSLAGMGVTVLSWACRYGIRDELKIAHFRGSALLVLPLLMFIGAYYFSMESYGAVTGFRLEALQGYGVDSDTGAKLAIEDAGEYFLSEYAPRLGVIAFWQYILNFVGVLLVAGWYVVNFAIFHRTEEN